MQIQKSLSHEYDYQSDYESDYESESDFDSMYYIDIPKKYINTLTCIYFCFVSSMIIISIYV